MAHPPAHQQTKPNNSELVESEYILLLDNDRNVELSSGIGKDDDDGSLVSWVEELKQQLKVAAPMIGVNFMQYSLQIVSLMFVGHQGALSLAGAALATSFANVSGFSVLTGLGGALETLCGQAYGGLQFRLLGVFLQRAILVFNLAAVLISFTWFNMRKLLLVLGQDATIAAKAGEYARWLIPGLFAYASLQGLVKFLQTQAVVLPMLFFSFITLVVHILLCCIFVLKFNFGDVGAALASSCSNWLNVALLVLYIRFSKSYRTTWVSFSKEAFNDLCGFLKLAIPSAVMICLEWWGFEAAVIFSGWLSNPELETSTLSICLNTLGLIFNIPFGISAAVSTRVSNELGAGHPFVARSSVRVALYLVAIEALLVASLLLCVRNVWGWAFSNEAKVVQHLATMIPLVACLSIMDAFQGVLSGIARGCGWQAFGAFANLGAYYFIGMPMTLIFGFVLHLGGQGLWTGVLCGVSTQVFILLIVTLTLNWDKQKWTRKDRSQCIRSLRMSSVSVGRN